MNQNRGTYIKYAIGEIFLVVVGILIALRISNWNEQNKERRFEAEILNEINESLTGDSKVLINLLENNLIADQHADKIFTLSDPELTSDSLAFWLGRVVKFERFRPLTSAYEVLKSKGLGVISNEELRLLLTTYYDDNIGGVIESLEDIETAFKRDWVPIIKRDFVDFKFGEIMVPASPTDFINGRENITNLKLFRENRIGLNLPLNKAIDINAAIQKLIAQEIDL